MFDFIPKAGIIYNKTGRNFYGNTIAFEERIICIGSGMRLGYKQSNFNAYSNVFSINQNSVSWYGVFAFGDSWGPTEENKAHGQLNGLNINYQYVFWG